MLYFFVALNVSYKILGLSKIPQLHSYLHSYLLQCHLLYQSKENLIFLMQQQQRNRRKRKTKKKRGMHEMMATVHQYVLFR